MNKLIIILILPLILTGCSEEIEKTGCAKYPFTEENCLKCESAGGIFFAGGAFSTDNCVFPPENNEN